MKLYDIKLFIDLYYRFIYNLDNTDNFIDNKYKY